MILQRVENDDKIDVIYESSNILSSTLDKSTENLTIIFKNGGSYTYLKVSPTDYMRFETADSQGKVLNSNIKAYAFSKNDSVDVDKILKEIKILKDKEQFKSENELKTMMAENVEYFEQYGIFDKSSIKLLKDKLGRHITEYKL